MKSRHKPGLRGSPSKEHEIQRVLGSHPTLPLAPSLFLERWSSVISFLISATAFFPSPKQPLSGTAAQVCRGSIRWGKGKEEMKERKVGERGCKGYKGRSKEVRRKGGKSKGGGGEAWEMLTLLPRPRAVALKRSD